MQHKIIHDEFQMIYAIPNHNLFVFRQVYFIISCGAKQTFMMCRVDRHKLKNLTTVIPHMKPCGRY